MKVLRLLIESWFDRRNVSKIWRIVRENPELSGFFSSERTAVYRLPLPPSANIRIQTHSQPVRSFTRTPLEDFFLGDRLYLLDSAPLADFAKPMTLLAFRGFDERPHLQMQANYHILLNGDPLPLFDWETLSNWAVWNREAIPVHGAPDELAPLVFADELPPLTGPFPKGDVPPPVTEPKPSDAPPTTTDSCQPVFLFRALCFQNPIARDPKKNRDHMHEQAHRYKEIWGKRGYNGTARVLVAGDTYPTFEKMLDELQRDLQASKFCNCPGDQLVLCLCAHGEKGSVDFQPNKNTAETISVDRLMNRIAGIPKIAASPQKVLFLVQSCGSGQFLELPMPSKLAGMHVITSSPSGEDISYGGELSRYIEEALKRPDVKTWQDLVNWVKWNWDQDKKKSGKVPKNGDFTGCRIKATLKNVKYTGDNVGEEWSFVVRGFGQETAIPKHHVAHGATTDEGKEVLSLLIPKCPADVDLHLSASTAVARPGKNDFTMGMEKSKKVTCPGTGPDELKIDVPSDPEGKNCNLEFTFTIEKACL